MNFNFTIRRVIPMLLFVFMTSISFGSVYELATAKSLAKESGKNIFVNYTASWCLPCQLFKQRILSDQNVVSTLNSNFVVFTADYDDTRIKQTYSDYNVCCLPTLHILDEAGEILTEIPKTLSAKQFLEELLKFSKKPPIPYKLKKPISHEPPSKYIDSNSSRLSVFYTIQVGAFSSRLNAQKLKSKLDASFNNVLVDKDIKREMFLVQIGKATTRQELNYIVSILKEEGIDHFIKRKEAHLLIEDFMLLANKEVAKFVANKEKPEIPFIYRVHDEPNPDKIAEFARFALELGIPLKMDTPKQIAESFNELGKRAEEEDALKMLQPIAIRTMAKAEYTSENIGHYGLAFDFYSHFTSPIRRYSDVLCHRILQKVLTSKNYRVNKEELEDQCRHISFQERKAMDSERESIKYKQVEYIEKNVGETFEGIISGIIDRGLFIELKVSKCEGMASFDTLGESFSVAEGRLKATGNRTGKEYKMGDTVSVTITGADLQKRQIDMRLNVEEEELW